MNKGESKTSTSIHLFLLPSCGSNVASHPTLYYSTIKGLSSPMTRYGSEASILLQCQVFLHSILIEILAGFLVYMEMGISYMCGENLG